jgi:hypothetical protein
MGTNDYFREYACLRLNLESGQILRFRWIAASLHLVIVGWEELVDERDEHILRRLDRIVDVSWLEHQPPRTDVGSAGGMGGDFLQELVGEGAFVTNWRGDSEEQITAKELWRHESVPLRVAVGHAAGSTEEFQLAADVWSDLLAELTHPKSRRGFGVAETAARKWPGVDKRIALVIVRQAL